MPLRKNKKRRQRLKRAKERKNKEALEKKHDPKRSAADVSDVMSLFNSNFARITLDTDLKNITVNKDDLEDQFFILGEGSFGLVTLGVFYHSDGKRQRVALKAPLNYRYNEMFLNEAKVMMNFEHKNVIKILALQRSPLKIAMEYMDMGDVLDALKYMPFSKEDLLQVIHDVASGMEYISGKRYVHSDLACRNVFMNSQRQVKIGDLGLCQYVGDTDGMFILKAEGFHNILSAPEVISYGKFSTKSDVWSMGLLIWDLYFSADGGSILLKKFLLELLCEQGFRPAKPQRCPDDLYQYVKNNLLNDDANRRPSFTNVKIKLSELLAR